MRYQIRIRHARRQWLAAFSLGLVALLGATPCTARASHLRETPMVKAVAGARAAVVNIHGQKTVRADQDEFGSTAAFRQVKGMGTGVVIDQRGYIITNYHVVEGVAAIQVTLDDKTTVVARLVAHDPKTDLAIIKVDVGHKLPVINIGTSADLMPAEPVVAVGNAYGYGHTATQGIISELRRTVQVSDDQTYFDLIQTDASINPGNSGGPLMNIDGEMIGINVAVRVGAQGIGFAIPVDQVMETAAKLISAERRGEIRHGVSGKNTLDQDGVHFVIEKVDDDSPASNAGLKEGDVITAVADKTVVRGLDFETALLDHRAGDEIDVKIRRAGETLKLPLIIQPGQPAQVATTDRAWSVLGMQLEPIPAQAFRNYNTRYRGGMKVSAVRAGGPAERQGIRRGDVLVGMHIWETISQDNVLFVLNRPEFGQMQPLKFYILRGNETLYGHMNVSVDGGR